MITPFYARFSVSIVEKPFYADDGVSCAQTAVISFYDKNDRFLLSEDFGYLPITEIYRQIDDCKEINIARCYVHNFSLTAYRRTRLISKSDKVKLKGIKATYAFFDSEFQIDFSHFELEDGGVDFTGAHFAKGRVLFLGSNFSTANVSFAYAVFRPKLIDFSNAVFGAGDLTFKNATFYEGVKNFQYTDFGVGELIFVNTDFGGGEIAFLNTNFNTGNVSFKVADFGGGKVVFHYAKFLDGDVSFERTAFGNGEVDFRTVEFGTGKLNFNRADFGDGDVSFEASSAMGRITFKKTKFGAGKKNFELLEFNQSALNMEKADLGSGSVSFLNSAFKYLSLNGCHIDSYLDLRVSKCPKIDLTDTIVRDIVDFKPYDFNVDVVELNISGMRLLGTLYIDWNENKVESLIRGQKCTSLAEKAEQFRLLKENFNKAGQYDHEDRAYVWFKRYEAQSKYHLKTDDSLLKKILYAPIFAFEKLVFDYSGLYATEPRRVLFAMILTYVFFSLVYFVVLLAGVGGIVSGIGGEHDLLSSFARSFYHSGVTFLTIGYGDFYPLGAVRWLSNLEGFVGVFLMSYFTVAFVRKILR